MLSTTMVVQADRIRFPIRSKYALKPAISSALSTYPPEGSKTDLKLGEQQFVRSYTKNLTT
jgi:hypothetical protein